MPGPQGGRGGGQFRSPSTTYQRQLKGKRTPSTKPVLGRRAPSVTLQRREGADKQDADFGFARYEEGPPLTGYLVNMLSTSITDEDRLERSAVDLYFLQQDGKTFKSTLVYKPYFFLFPKEGHAKEVASVLERRFQGVLSAAEVLEKEDLEMANHLSGKKAVYIKLSFRTVQELMDVRRQLQPIIQKNKARASTSAAYGGLDDEAIPSDFLEAIMDMREYDVPYVTRVSIDMVRADVRLSCHYLLYRNSPQDVRVGSWYEVTPISGNTSLRRLKDMVSGSAALVSPAEPLMCMGLCQVEKAEPRVLAFDIECTKAPLKFPDANVDQVGPAAGASLHAMSPHSHSLDRFT